MCAGNVYGENLGLHEACEIDGLSVELILFAWVQEHGIYGYGKSVYQRSY
jgi:hypothetical protein